MPPKNPEKEPKPYIPPVGPGSKSVSPHAPKDRKGPPPEQPRPYVPPVGPESSSVAP